ncbi:MAG: class I SAM-dependent methyltransferase, partial [Nocardiopsaceae bacterium]|nr:class I SAM-dependent methyltransferase [Nocardiopsaceae bacterium]
RAEQAAAGAPVPVRVADGVATELPARDGEFDAVVFSGLLCSVPDVPAALGEFARVLRPGGEVRFYEHVRSADPLFAGFQRVADLAWPHLNGGCRVRRDTLPLISRVFTVESCRGFRFPPSAFLYPVAPRILGTARKPGNGLSRLSRTGGAGRRRRGRWWRGRGGPRSGRWREGRR